MALLPDLATLKKHLNKSAAVSADDDELADILEAAIDVVGNIVGPLTGDPITETHYGTYGAQLVLRKMPVTELTAISPRAVPGVTTTPLDPDDYVLDTETGILRVANGGWFVGDYTVTYSTGRATVPAAIRLAVMIVAAHLWETQRGTAPTPLQEPEFDNAGFNPGQGYAIPNRAVELLAPYRRPAIA